MGSSSDDNVNRYSFAERDPWCVAAEVAEESAALDIVAPVPFPCLLYFSRFPPCIGSPAHP